MANIQDHEAQVTVPRGAATEILHTDGHEPAVGVEIDVRDPELEVAAKIGVARLPDHLPQIVVQLRGPPLPDGILVPFGELVSEVFRHEFDLEAVDLHHIASRL